MLRTTDRLFGFWPRSLGTDGAFTSMRKGTPEAASKSEVAPRVPDDWTEEQRAVARNNQEKVAKVIKTKWHGKQSDLAQKIGVDPSGLSNLKRLGAHADTPTLQALCRALYVDADSLLRGVIKHVKPTFKRPDLHDLLDAVVGTPDEPAIERMLQAFVKAGKS